MKRRASTLALAATLLAGCTSTRQIRRPQTFEQLDPIVWKKRGAITLLYEGGTSAVPPAVADDARTGGAEVPLLEMSNLRGYEVKRRGRGTLDGLGLGILAGALVGTAIGSALASASHCDRMDGCADGFSAKDWPLAFGAVGAYAGGVVGALTGMLVGHTDRYVFSNDAADP